MSGPQSITLPPSLDCTLRQHRSRIRSVEAPFPGHWVYVTPIAPATTPADAVPGDPVGIDTPFLNGCQNVAGEQPVSFRIHPATRLALRGAVDVGPGAFPMVVFTLPDGYGFRPAYPHPVTFPSGDGSFIYTGRVDPNGDVWILGSVPTV
jgi:hypothetical protein